MLSCKEATRLVSEGLDRRLSPYELAVLPLSKKPELVSEAEKLADQLRPDFILELDVTQSIGRRYRRHDEIGTPFAVTFDFDSLDERPVDLIFLLLAPESAGADHLKALAKVSRLLRDRKTCEKLRSTDSSDAIYALLTESITHHAA